MIYKSIVTSHKSHSEAEELYQQDFDLELESSYLDRACGQILALIGRERKS